ncbi:hypothetical protein [Komarekiella delphini-convector]|nr:hypothetical protein [Komarekiella delphini-convector]
MVLLVCRRRPLFRNSQNLKNCLIQQSSSHSLAHLYIMITPKVFADFQNADAEKRLRLNCIGTIEDLANQSIELQDGQLLTLYSEDLEVDGVVQFSEEEKLWVAAIDWERIRQVEDLVVQAQV